MNKGLVKIDEALHIGELELGSLKAGEVEEAEEYALRRVTLVREAGLHYEPACAEEFKAKLMQMQSLQGKLTIEAKQLHAYLQDEIKKGKKQADCHRGYSKTLTTEARIIPSFMDKKS